MGRGQSQEVAQVSTGARFQTEQSEEREESKENEEEKN